LTIIVALKGEGNASARGIVMTDLLQCTVLVMAYSPHSRPLLAHSGVASYGRVVNSAQSHHLVSRLFYLLLVEDATPEGQHRPS